MVFAAVATRPPTTHQSFCDPSVFGRSLAFAALRPTQQASRVTISIVRVEQAAVRSGHRVEHESQLGGRVPQRIRRRSATIRVGRPPSKGALAPAPDRRDQQRLFVVERKLHRSDL